MPIVAIVGRPNVGKSSLLNAMAKKRISIVDPTAGVTRDRISAIIDHEDQYFELVDTGGLGIEDHDNLTEHVENQINLAIEKASLVIFLVDVREGALPLDQKVAELLRDRPIKVLLVANKADEGHMDPLAGEFHKLGFGQPLCISAKHARNRTVLLKEIFSHLEQTDTAQPKNEVMKMAIVGKQNVGKSTFINQLAGEDRVIVSEVAGTTRDSIDVRFEKDDNAFIAIDTAGVKKKKKMYGNDIDFYSYTRAIRSIRRADVVLFFLDASSSISQVDKKLANYIVEQFKPCIIVINKWDIAMENEASTDDYQEYIDKMLPGLSFAPICFITAIEGKNIQSLVDLAQQLFKQINTTVTTSQLNKAINAITAERAPSVRHKVGLPRIYYSTQVSNQPPTLMLFVNNPNKLDENYQRFLINRLRDVLPFSEVPIRLLMRHHQEKLPNTAS